MNLRHCLNVTLLAASLVVTAAVPVALAHGVPGSGERLPRIGPAHQFSLTAHDRSQFNLHELKGKVVALNFIFARCTDVCPLATAKMVRIQNALGDQFGRDVFFLSVTVDPEHDTPEVLAKYARALGCNESGWRFLTGSESDIQTVARRYGVYSKSGADGDVDHILITSLIDRTGTLRVQYLGERFNPDELLHDLQTLTREHPLR